MRNLITSLFLLYTTSLKDDTFCFSSFSKRVYTDSVHPIPRVPSSLNQFQHPMNQFQQNSRSLLQENLPMIHLSCPNWCRILQTAICLRSRQWIIGKVFPGVKNGYFVEIVHGMLKLIQTRRHSRTRMERICIDRFRELKNRKCHLLGSRVQQEREVIKFRMADVLGGIDTDIARHKLRLTHLLL